MAIVVACDACGKRYKVDERFAGTSKRCKICGSGVAIPPTAAGPILRHQPRTKPFEVATGDSRAIEQIEAHINNHIGNYDQVFHEIVSDLVHVDIHVVEPTAERGWYTLVTSGMSDRPMTVPEGAEGSRHAELMLALPPDWPMRHEDWADEANYWPIRWLKMLARLPHEYDTWLGFGHTVPNGDPPEPFAADTELCGVLLAPPLTVPPEFHELELEVGRTILFWAVVPLYEREMSYKLEHGAEALLERFDKHGVSELLDIERKNVCRRGFFR